MRQHGIVAASVLLAGVLCDTTPRVISLGKNPDAAPLTLDGVVQHDTLQAAAQATRDKYLATLYTYQENNGGIPLKGVAKITSDSGRAAIYRRQSEPLVPQAGSSCERDTACT